MRDIRKLILNSDSLAGAVVKEDNKSAAAHLCTIVTMAVAGIVFLVSLIIFLLHDVVLFNPDYHTTSGGALVSMNSCDREISQYLFNTSELWADSGIQVGKGDRLRITASGSFNSSFNEVLDAARNNCLPRYAWVGSKARHEGGISDSAEGKLCPDTYIGAILFRIGSPAEVMRNVRGGRIRPVDTRHAGKVKADTGGTLYFAVNDIVLDATEPNPAAWYADNIGQLLVTVDIERRIHGAPLTFKFWFRLIEDTLTSVWGCCRIAGPVLSIAAGALIFFLLIPLAFFLMGLVLSKLLYWAFYGVLTLGEGTLAIASKIIEWTHKLL